MRITHGGGYPSPKATTMSDGNFNTKLLAPGGFASGVRSGEARMKQRALKVFNELVDSIEELPAERREALKRTFKVRLD